MPYLFIQTNKPLGENEQSQLLADASKGVATVLDKPEKYVMGAWASAPKMIFDGHPDGAAFLELRRVGIPESGREKIPGARAKCMAQHLGISADHVELVLSDVPDTDW